PGFEIYLGAARFSEANRNLLNRSTLSLPSIARSLRQASALFVSNHTSLHFLPSSVQPKCQIVPPNALRPEDENRSPPPARPQNGGAFKLLYVGNCVATRAIPIVIESLAALSESGLNDFQLDIVGDGPAVPDWKNRTAALGVSTKVRFVGKVPYV